VTQEVTVYHDVQVWCDLCGKGLCNQTQVKRNELYVTPCQDCLDSEHEAGYEKGYEEGYEKGIEHKSKND